MSESVIQERIRIGSSYHAGDGVAIIDFSDDVTSGVNVGDLIVLENFHEYYSVATINYTVSDFVGFSGVLDPLSLFAAHAVGLALIVQ